MAYPRFQLPEGHMYANVVSGRTHTGDDPLDRLWLASAQRRLRVAWGARDVTPSGTYDATMVEAVGAVQRAYGLPVTGWLDRDTWDVIWGDNPTVE